MLKQVQTAVTFRSKSTIGTKLLVKCKSCHASFDQSYDICPYCGWKFGDPITAEDITIANGYLETYILGSAKGDKYCDERDGSYGHELIRFTVNLNTPELAKLFEVLLDLRDKDGCRYTMKLVG